MEQLTRITLNPKIMGGKPCIRGLGVAVGTIIVGLMATGRTPEEILKAYPCIENYDHTLHFTNAIAPLFMLS